MPLINFAAVPGRLLVTVQAVAGGPSYLGGTPYDPVNKAWACSRFQPIVRWLNGMPLDADGLLVLAPSNTAPTSYSGGIGFAANGAICNSVDAPIARYEGGWPVSVEGMICIEEVGAAATAPGPVTNAVASSAVAGVLHVTWTAPVSNGGSPITYYRLGTVPGGYETYPGPAAVSADIGVPAGTYTVDVRACNDIGEGQIVTTNSAVVS